MKPIELKDFYGFKCLSELAYSADGKMAAFVVTTPNSDGYKYDFNLYTYDFAKKQTLQLTSHGDSRGFIWRENSLLFMGNRQEKQDDVTNFYTISTQGGEAQFAFSIPHQVGQIKEIDSENLAFVAKFDHNKAAFDKLTPDQQKEEKDYIIVDELPYWFNGMGYINKTRKVLYTYHIPTGKVTQISNKWSNVSSVNAQGDALYYVSSMPYKEVSKRTSELWHYNHKTGENVKLIKGGKYKIGGAGVAFGKLLCILSDMKQYGVGENSNVYTLENGEPKVFFTHDRSFGSSVGSDCRYGGGSSLKFCADGMYYTTTTGTNSQLHKLNQSGKAEILVEKEGAVDMFDVHDGAVVYVGMHGQQLQELYDLKGRLTTINEAVLRDKTVVRPEKMEVLSDGVLIEGFVMKPTDFHPKKQYPAIMNVHGGPHAVYGNIYLHEMQVWANKGYFVFFSNPRGSDGRGDAFADLRGKYGTIDFDDVMRFTDGVLEKYPQIDEKKIGITGGSYGGFMTNWAIGHTRRYAAAVSQRSIANWIAMENIADIGFDFDIDQTGGTAWKNMRKVWDQSPLKAANKAKTPTLFIHSDEDYRCPLVEGMQMFTAIRQVGCPAKMCIFKGENHELSRSGKPRHRARRLLEITNWFELYLKGKK